MNSQENNYQLNDEEIFNQLYHASISAQRWQYTDLTNLILSYPDTIERIQWQYNRIAKTINSPEFKEYKLTINSILEKIKWQQFIFDIEWVVMNEVAEINETPIYLIEPKIIPIILKLVKNNNSVWFWTAASWKFLEIMKKSIIQELSNLSAISINDFEKIVLAYLDKSNTPEQVLKLMQSIFPEANIEAYNRWLNIFNSQNFDINSLRSQKYPQIFINPETWFFIDDNKMYLETAIDNGWPEKRAIKVMPIPNKNDYIKLAEDIKSWI